MGTHESGPSFVVQAPRASNGVSVDVDDNVGVSLKKWISENPNVLGDKVLHNWGCDLPFLFKVQSTNSARFSHYVFLSINLNFSFWVQFFFVLVCFWGCFWT